MELTASYKHSEVGVIPADWDVKSLGEIGDCLIGLTYRPSNVRPYGLLVLRASNIGGAGLRFEDNVFVDVDVPSKLIVRNGDILICVRNGSRELIGKCALIDEQAHGMTFGAFMAVFRTPHNQFVFQQLQSPLIKRQIHEHLGATINQITNKSLKSFHIPLPRRGDEERAIATASRDADALIGALDRLIAKKRDLKQAAMLQLLSGNQRLPGFSAEWKVRSYGKLFRFLKTANNPRADLSAFGQIGYIHYGDIHTTTSAFLNCADAPLPRIAQNRVAGIPFLEDGDLVMADASEDYAGIGKCVEIRDVRDHKIVAGLHTLLLRGDRALLADGFKGYLQFMPSVTTSLVRLATGISVYGASKNNVRTIEVLLPPVDEQSAIAKVLSDMDAEIDGLEHKSDKTRALKQGMMQELLTGKSRLV